MELHVIGDYTIKEKIGEGSYSSVFLAQNLKGAQFALKLIPKHLIKSSKLQVNLSNEIRIMRGAAHENIANLKETIVHNKYICLVVEYVAGGDLSKYIRQHVNLSEATALHLLNQLTTGLLFLEEQNIIHRDLKPQNLLLSDHNCTYPHLKICDFGFARYLSSEVAMAQTPCGTPLYCAPEVFLMQEYNGKADVWSVGCIFYEMLFGSTPYTGSNPRELFMHIKQNPFKLPLPVPRGRPPVSAQSTTLVKMMLEFEPQCRAPLLKLGEAVEKLCNARRIRRDVGSWTLVNAEVPTPTISVLKGGSAHSKSPVRKYREGIHVVQLLVHLGDGLLREAIAYRRAEHRSVDSPRSVDEARTKANTKTSTSAAIYYHIVQILRDLDSTIPALAESESEQALVVIIRSRFQNYLEGTLDRLKFCKKLISGSTKLPPCQEILKKYAADMLEIAEIENMKGNSIVATKLKRTAELLISVKPQP
eukprot:GSChrysophyteH1.ASY1.ANO1.512.1 assembled CDS